MSMTHMRGAVAMVAFLGAFLVIALITAGII